MGDVDFDLRNKGVKRWRTTALDRKEWVSVIRETRPDVNGCSDKEEEEEEEEQKEE